jgi:hypothetical protein
MGILKTMHEAEERAMRDTLDMLENMVAQLDAMNALLKSRLDQIRRLETLDNDRKGDAGE